MATDSTSPGSESPRPLGEPRGKILIRTAAMPENMNSRGHIFGGWVLGQMDIAGGIAAAERAKGRVATVAIKEMKFAKPVEVGDLLTCYVELGPVGRTSITTYIDTWVHRHRGGEIEEVQVTKGEFVYVALDDDGKPRPVPN